MRTDISTTTLPAHTHHKVAPPGVSVQALVHIVLQGNGQAVHEGGAGGDGVAVPHMRRVLFGDVNALLPELLPQALLLTPLRTPPCLVG